MRRKGRENRGRASREDRERQREKEEEETTKRRGGDEENKREEGGLFLTSILHSRKNKSICLKAG